jgi:pilus assembly protein CpaB
MQSTLSGSGSDRRVLVAALILGAIAAGLAVSFLASADGGGGGSPTASAATRAVVVASQEIEVGDTVEASMLEVRELPLVAVIEGAAEEIEQVVGETARYPISTGEQVNAVRLVEPPKVQALSFQIPEGLRGFTIGVDANASPAGLLAPGDFVDILVAGSIVDLVTEDSTYTNRSALIAAPSLLGEGQAVTTLLQNIQILSVQQAYVANGVVYDESTRGAPPEVGVSNVTLALTPPQAELLWLATQTGEVTLTLRAFGDDEISVPGQVSNIGGQ